MENLNDKIEKVKVEIVDKCNNDDRELIKDYWSYNEYNYELNMLPSQITIKYNITQTELNERVAKSSNISLYVRCNYCEITEYNIFTSQARYRSMIKELKNLGEAKYKCKQCRYLEEENVQHQTEAEAKATADREQKRISEILQNIKKSVANKRWEVLSEFENVVLKNAIILNNFVELQRYYSGMGVNSKLLISALKILEAEHLLYLEYDRWDKTKIERYAVSGLLRSEYVYQPKGNKTAKYSSNEPLNSKDNLLKLHLSTALNQHHPNCPPLSATFIPKEDIILKSGIEYLCNLYNRRDGNVSITINPSKKEKDLPKHIKLEDLPAPLRKQVEDYLRSTDEENEA